MSRLLLGLLVGFLFGFLLQKGQVAKFRTIVGQLTLTDFTVVRIMLTAIIVGGIGVYILKGAGLVTLHVKPLPLGAVVIGGLIFGVGMALLGYCPGTAIAAAGQGSRTAWWGILGMLAGAAVFAELFTWLSPLLSWRDLGPVTLPGVTGLPAYVCLVILVALVLPFFRWLDKKELNRG
jgi:uncharacterized membrane protein YedE/YeeE